jgi:glutamine synthetase
MLVMEVLRGVAEKHGLRCLLHEKPFAGVNGSGKHNNWSVCGPDGKNWLTPGENPHDNAKFLTLICALMKAVDTHADLLRATVATANNDHRLGANEAPPAIVSIFLGEQLTDLMMQLLAAGTAKTSKKGGILEVGMSSLPPLPRDATDRNRTSPFAFTGNKFEFRAVGSSQSCAGPNVALNTIVAEALDEICTQLEADKASGMDFNSSLQAVLQGVVRKHRRILFDGDNYTDEWKKEARRRGLPNLKNTPEALKAIISPQSVAMFVKYGVFTEREVKSRYEVYQHAYDQTVAIEASTALTMAQTMILPAALRYQKELADALRATASAGAGAQAGVKKLLRKLAADIQRMIAAGDALRAAADAHDSGMSLQHMTELRAAADDLEGVVPRDLWPLPTYAEMMFML